MRKGKVIGCVVVILDTKITKPGELEVIELRNVIGKSNNRRRWISTITSVTASIELSWCQSKGPAYTQCRCILREFRSDSVETSVELLCHHTVDHCHACNTHIYITIFLPQVPFWFPVMCPTFDRNCMLLTLQHTSINFKA